MSKLVLALFVISTLNCFFSDDITCAKEITFAARQIGQHMAQCFNEYELINCLENKISETLDNAIANNDTWQVTDFLLIEKNTNTSNTYLTNRDNLDELQILLNKHSRRSPFNNSLALKMLQLVQTRLLKIQFPSTLLSKLLYKRNIDSVLDDFIADVSDVKSEDIGTSEKLYLAQEEGRRKKDKDKNMAMVGGMAMLAMVAQMFLGKVILIAGAAFVMAKVALLISAMGSLKSGTSGSGFRPDHVIVTGNGVRSGSDHSYETISDWHRSIPNKYKQFQIVAPDEHKFTEPVVYYDVADKKFKTRNQYLKLPIKNNLNKINR